MTDFSQLNLPASLTQALQKLNFQTPTPIQAQAIPIALEGKDLIGCAQTGTGKTAAFGIPLIARLIADKQTRALILAPTRELALQITEVLRKLSIGHNDLWPALVMGGTNMRQQQQHLRRNPRVIIATPGRLIDHMGQRTVSFENVGLLVLDEADQMLDMGFGPQLDQILKVLPTERQTVLFSATLPEKIVAITKRFMKSPQRVTIGEVSRPIEKINQTILNTTAKTKNDMLLDELNARKGTILVFVRTKSRVERLNTYLEEYGYSVARIHGGRSQAQRNSALNAFRKGEIRILVATDVAARGLDIPHIAHVINYDLPMAPEDYVHRIGRTGRAGAVGESLSMLTPEDRDMWRKISRFIDPKGEKGLSQKTFSRPPVGANSRRDYSRADSRDDRPAKPTFRQKSFSAHRSEMPEESGGRSRPRREEFARKPFQRRDERSAEAGAYGRPRRDGDDRKPFFKRAEDQRGEHRGERRDDRRDDRREERSTGAFGKGPKKEGAFKKASPEGERRERSFSKPGAPRPKRSGGGAFRGKGGGYKSSRSTSHRTARG